MWQDKCNQPFLLLAFGLFLAEFIIFEIHYPYASYMPDCYGYLDAAFQKAAISRRPPGLLLADNNLFHRDLPERHLQSCLPLMVYHISKTCLRTQKAHEIPHS